MYLDAWASIGIRTRPIGADWKRFDKFLQYKKSPLIK